MCEKPKEMYYPDGKTPSIGERLIHVHNRKTDEWAWMCLVCGKIMASHKMNVPHGIDGSWRVLQSKGAASRHLETHNKNFVNHGININEITHLNKNLCKSCGAKTISRKNIDQYSPLIKSYHIPAEEDTDYCPMCMDWRTKKEIYQRKLKSL